MRKKEMPKMKKGDGILLKSVIFTLLIFMLSVFTVQAKDAGSEGKQGVINDAGTTGVITVKVLPVVNEKNLPKQSDLFSLAGVNNENDGFKIDLSQGNYLDRMSAKPITPVKNEPEKTDQIYEPHRYLKRNFKIRKVERAFFTSSLVVLATLNIADYFSTKEALKYPGLSEGNPVMKPLVKNSTVFAAVKIGTTALTYLALQNLYKRDKKWGWVVSTALNFALSYVVMNNFKLINKAKSGSLCSRI